VRFNARYTKDRTTLSDDSGQGPGTVACLPRRANYQVTGHERFLAPDGALWCAPRDSNRLELLLLYGVQDLAFTRTLPFGPGLSGR